MRVSTGEYELAYEIEGSGDPLLVLHWGMFGDRTQLRGLSALLPGTKILFDGRVYGDSDAPAASYTLEDYADHVAAAIRQVAGSPAVLVGQSMGAMTFLRLARRHPELVAGLVLIDTSAATEDPDLAPTYEALLATLVDNGPSAELLDFVGEASLMSAGFIAENPELFSQWRDTMLDLHVEGFVAHARAVFDRTDFRGELPQITVPAVVVVGELDTSTPPDRSRELAAALPDCRGCVEIPGAGHFAAWEQPRATAEAVRPFLDEVVSA